MRLGDLDHLLLKLDAELNDDARYIDIADQIRNIIDNVSTFDITKNQAYDQGFITAMKLYSRSKGEWIPVTTRPMTDEEYDDYKSEFGEYVERPYMFTGPMPEPDQEILVSSKFGVSLDTCIFDEYGFGLETNGDWDGILAWMPLPEKYNSEVKYNETDN